MWVLEYLDDIASDLSVFHRIDDANVLNGPAFFRLVFRLAAYQGVIRGRLEAVLREDPPAQQPFEYSSPPATSAARVNPGTRTTLQADPDMAGIFSFGSFGSDG